MNLQSRASRTLGVPKCPLGVTEQTDDACQPTIDVQKVLDKRIGMDGLVVNALKSILVDDKQKVILKSR